MAKELQLLFAQRMSANACILQLLTNDLLRQVMEVQLHFLLVIDIFAQLAQVTRHEVIRIAFSLNKLLLVGLYLRLDVVRFDFAPSVLLLGLLFLKFEAAYALHLSLCHDLLQVALNYNHTRLSTLAKHTANASAIDNPQAKFVAGAVLEHISFHLQSFLYHICHISVHLLKIR